MTRLSFGNEGPKPMPPAWLLPLLRAVPIVLLAVVLVCICVYSAAWGGAVSIPRDRVCTALGKSEGCEWRIVAAVDAAHANDEPCDYWRAADGSIW